MTRHRCTKQCTTAWCVPWVSTYADTMRTSVTLPEAAYRRVKMIAQRRGTSLSAVIAEMAVRGLDLEDEPDDLDTNPVSGLSVVRLGRPLTSPEVARMLEEDERADEQ